MKLYIVTSVGLNELKSLSPTTYGVSSIVQEVARILTRLTEARYNQVI